MMPIVIKIFLPSLLALLVGFAITPSLTRFMYKKKMWKHLAREVDNPDAISKTYETIHNTQEEVRTPRIGGVIIWGGVCITALLIFLTYRFVPSDFTRELDFLSTNQTLLPFIAFIFGGIFGLCEDILEIYPKLIKRFSHGLDDKYLIGLVVLFATVYACWFYFKLDMSSVYIPFSGPLEIGWLFIPLVIIVTLGIFSSRVIDGIDGLAGGVMAIIYGGFGFIALGQMQIDIATLCFVVAGSLLAFLWFNVPPARFYMGETGMMALTLLLAVIIFLLDRTLWILIMGFPLVATSFSSFAQILSKRYLGKKLFLVAPLHHHFQALGWGSEKVTMRYWIFTLMAVIAGILLAFIG